MNNIWSNIRILCLSYAVLTLSNTNFNDLFMIPLSQNSERFSIIQIT